MTEASTVSRRRRLPTPSCTECRTRKIQCDRKEPCGQCVRAARTVRCSYQGSHTQNSLPRQITKARFRHVKFTPEAHAAISDEAPLIGPQARLTALENRVRELERGRSQPDQGGRGISGGVPLYTAGLQQQSIVEQDQAQSPMLVEFLQGKNSKTRLYARSHWVGRLLQLEDVRTFLTGPRKFEIRDAEYLSLKRDDPGSLPLPDQSLQILEQFRVPQEFADELMAAYVSNFETGYRILHLPTFFRQYSTFWERPQESHTIFKAMLLVVMAIGHGTVVKGQGREISIHEMSEWISVAEHWAFSVPQKDTLRLEYVQLSCLLLLYRRLNTVDLNVPWLCASALVRTAMVMGLHRDPSCFARTTPLHAEIRRRLWYTIVELDLQSAISAGMPPSVTLAHCDCRYPLNLHDEELSEDCGAGEDLPSRDLTTCTRTAFQIVMLRSLETRWRIANIAATKTRSLSREEFISLDHKLAEWFTAMPPYCTGRTGALTVDIGQSCVLPAAMLKTIHHAAWISLHGASLDQHSIASGHLKQRAMQSALQVLAQLDPPSPAPSVCSLATIGGEMVRDPVLHASFILCLELSAEAEVIAAQSAVPHNNGEPRLLSPATQEMLQSLHSAETYLVYHLRRGLPVSKYYLFLRMAIASVHARLHGKPPLQAVKAAFHAAVGECKSYYASGPKDNMPPDHGVAPLPATFPDWINSSPVAASPADVVAGNETTVNIWSAPSPSLFDILMAEFDAQFAGTGIPGLSGF